MDAISKKLVIVGDGAVGKTCLIQLLTDHFPSESVPTIVYNNTKGIEVDGKQISTTVSDRSLIRTLASSSCASPSICHKHWRTLTRRGRLRIFANIEVSTIPSESSDRYSWQQELYSKRPQAVHRTAIEE
ncbi:hypothetical protein PENTCL1PPCAC_3257 [Pristionchus entomophagus]|uniref:ADP ribosylation factor n=1 Tax=Pristionchus entomophagus TaxID=358040 RepID=A0AAV5SEF8_9BILA|nr:hypothetical protein PENTCL1PPCAC_3257 [Pristionchus entomophagus]